MALAKKSIQIIRYLFFLFFEENICCGYSLEALPLCFLREIRKKLVIFGEVNHGWTSGF